MTGRLLLSLMLALVLLSAADISRAGDVKKGKAVFETCVVCHGEKGEGQEVFGSPKLAGQHDWYLVLQLENFRAGIRGTHEDDENGPIMQPIAEQLSDDDIENVVDYIRTLDPGGSDEE